MAIKLYPEACIYCGNKAYHIKKVGKYEVGLCLKHFTLTNKTILKVIK